MQKKPFNPSPRPRQQQQKGRKQDDEPNYAINDEITSPEVRVVGDNVEQGRMAFGCLDRTSHQTAPDGW